MPKQPIGWADKPSTDPEVVALRDHLERNNGIQDLEVAKADQIERIVKLFRRDGFVAVNDVLNSEQVEFLATGCLEVVDEIIALDSGHGGNRGSHRQIPA